MGDASQSWESERDSIGGGEEYKEVMHEGRRKDSETNFLPLRLALPHNKTNTATIGLTYFCQSNTPALCKARENGVGGSIRPHLG